MAAVEILRSESKQKFREPQQDITGQAPIIKLNSKLSLDRVTYTETYRSGHNGADSKSVCGQPHVSSNLTVSAILRGFCKSKSLVFLLETREKPLETAILTA